MGTYSISPRRIQVQAIPSRYNLFWWEVVEVYRDQIVSCLGQFRSESEANDYITKYVNVV